MPTIQPTVEAASVVTGELGFWTCTALVVGNTIGIGIFLLPSALAPFGFNAVIGWGVTVAGCMVLARVFSRLASQFPEEDGTYGYIRRTLGDTAAFGAMWCYWVSVWVTNATIAVGLVGYIEAVFPALTRFAPTLVIALGLQWLFVLVNLFGVRSGGIVQMVTGALKLLPMAAVILLGTWLLISHPSLYAQHPPTTPLSFGQSMGASTLALFAMLGLESAAVPAGRVRDPGRTIPMATMVGTLATAAIYVLVSIITMLLIPQAELARSTAPFVDLLNRFITGDVGRWLALFVVISGLGALNGWILVAGELTRAMAARGVMPAPFARVNRHGAPIIGLMVTAGLGSAVVMMNYSKSLVQGFTFLSVMVTAANLPLYLLAGLALVVLWFRGKGAALRGLLVIGGLGAAYTVFAFIGAGVEPLTWAAILAAAGLGPYLIMRRRRARRAAAESPAH